MTQVATSCLAPTIACHDIKSANYSWSLSHQRESEKSWFQILICKANFITLAQAMPAKSITMMHLLLLTHTLLCTYSNSFLSSNLSCMSCYCITLIIQRYFSENFSISVYRWVLFVSGFNSLWGKWNRTGSIRTSIKLTCLQIYQMLLRQRTQPSRNTSCRSPKLKINWTYYVHTYNED